MVLSFEQLQPGETDLHQLKSCEESFRSADKKSKGVPYYCRSAVARELAAESCKISQFEKTYTSVKEFIAEIPDEAKDGDIREIVKRKFLGNIKFLDVNNRILVTSERKSNFGFDLWFHYGRDSNLTHVDLVQIIYPPLSATSINRVSVEKVPISLRNVKREKWVKSGRSCTITFDGIKFTGLLSSENDLLFGSFKNEDYGNVRVAVSKSWVLKRYSEHGKITADALHQLNKIMVDALRQTELEALC